MKPITYWVQNDVIDQLVNQFGAYLEKLSGIERRLLLTNLEMIILCRIDQNFVAFVEEAAGGVPTTRNVQTALELLGDGNMTLHEADLLIEAIAATLNHHGNPWVENARANVAVAQAHAPQKKGTSSHEDAH